MVCPVIGEWSRVELKTEFINNKEDRGASFMLLDCDGGSAFALTIKAIRLAAAYRTYNWLRHFGGHIRKGDIEGMLSQSAREAIIGHDGAARCFHHRSDPGRV